MEGRERKTLAATRETFENAKEKQLLEMEV
jgi:hypothetical protein